MRTNCTFLAPKMIYDREENVKFRPKFLHRAQDIRVTEPVQMHVIYFS